MQVTAIAREETRTARTEPAAGFRVGGAAFSEILDSTRSEAPPLHTVKRGENLSRICRDFLRGLGKSPTAPDIYAAVERVAQANNLANKDLIHPGQELDLSCLASKIETIAPAPTASEAPVAAGPRPEPPEPLRPTNPEFAAAFAAFDMPLNLISAPLGFLEPMGPVGTADEMDTLPTPLNVEKALQTMATRLREGRDEARAVEAESPWRQVLGAPARLTSEFGVRRDPLTRRWQHHDGIDLATAKGTEIRPFRPGEVVYSGWQPGYGKVVIVRHDDGLESVYGHNSKNRVRVGQRVDVDTPLAEVGSTGRSTGPHLHFEVRRDGVAIDPIPFLAATPSIDVAEAF